MPTRSSQVEHRELRLPPQDAWRVKRKSGLDATRHESPHGFVAELDNAGGVPPQAVPVQFVADNGNLVALYNVSGDAVSSDSVSDQGGARIVDGEQIEAFVRDDGPGIPPAAIERVFERFYRVDKARSREQGGTGLGLSIVKHIVQSHGGRVWVESSLGQGATFFFTLPRERQRELVL